MKHHFNCRFSVEEERKICDLYQESVFNNTNTLGKVFNCNPRTIYCVLLRNGVKPRGYSNSQKGLQAGERNPRWKNGNTWDGYRRIYVNGKLIQEHRHILQQYLGRNLKPSEIVHHINGNKLDNRIDNLQLVSRSEHAKLHWADPKFSFKQAA